MINKLDCLDWFTVRDATSKREINGLLQAWALKYKAEPMICCIGHTTKGWLLAHRKLLNATTKACLLTLFKTCSYGWASKKDKDGCILCRRRLGSERGKVIWRDYAYPRV